MQGARIKIWIILTFSSSVIHAQKFPTKPYWSYSSSLSSSHFLSDLGGKDGDGTSDFRDLDLNKTRYALGGGMQYTIPEVISFGVEVNWARLAADDRETQSGRTPRMISVRTDIVETNFLLSYTTPRRAAYFSGVYFFAGGGLAYYKPQAEWNGIWYDLRSLGTEGQLADPSKEAYAKFTPIIPFGFGKKYYLNNGITLSAELNFRKSFTDYLDDVSTVYFDNNQILASTGVAAAHFANPSSNPGMGVAGNKRGNPKQMDNYFFIGTKLQIPIRKTYRRRGRSNLFDAYGMHWLDKWGQKKN